MTPALLLAFDLFAAAPPPDVPPFDCVVFDQTVFHTDVCEPPVIPPVIPPTPPATVGGGLPERVEIWEQRKKKKYKEVYIQKDHDEQITGTIGQEARDLKDLRFLISFLDDL